MIDVGNEAQVKEQKITKKMIRGQELADLKEILSYPYGRRFLWRMLAWCGIFKLSFSEENNLTNFKEGMRNTGLMLLSECELAEPNMYLLMQKEASDKNLNERDK